MKVLFWPYWRQPVEDRGSLQDFLRKLKLEKKHPKLYALAKATIELAEKPDGLEALTESGHAGMLQYNRGLWEFRIPPRMKGGVLRIYFCMPRVRNERIVCLDAELKKDSESSPQKLDSAQRKFTQMGA